MFINQKKPSDKIQEKDIVIEKVDLKNELVVIKNLGKNDVNMTGWKLVSTKGNQVYHFPSGFVLKAGQSVNIRSGRSAFDNPPKNLKWSGAYIWNNEGDLAELYDANGKLIS